MTRSTLLVSLLFSLAIHVGCAENSSTAAEPCSVSDNADGTVTISCPDGSSVTFDAAVPGQDGSSCSALNNEDGSYSIVCTDGSSFDLYDGEPGDAGSDGEPGGGCSVSDAPGGGSTITCDDGTTVTVEDGDSCTLEPAAGGQYVLVCEDGTVAPVSVGVVLLVEDEPAGYTCEFGGVKISAGADANSNGELDPEEVASVQYLCGDVVAGEACSLFSLPDTSLWPQPDSVDQHLSAHVPARVSVGLPVDGFSFSLSPAGVATTVPGVGVADLANGRYTFTPDALLEPDTVFEASITVSAAGCDASSWWSFTTSSYGHPLLDEQSLVGETYAVDIGDCDSGGYPLGQLIDMVLLFRVESLAEPGGTYGKELELLLASSRQTMDGTSQHACYPTSNVTADFGAAPSFETSSMDLIFVDNGMALTIEDATLYGVVAQDLATIGHVYFHGLA